MSEEVKKIGITGGKGGTGKSTVAVLLAKDLSERGNRVVLADCDVEAPDDHLLIGRKLDNQLQKLWSELPEIDKDKCTKCGLCVEACKENAIFQAPGKYPVVNRELCTGCGACWQVCPEDAITPQKKEVGQIYLNKINENLYLVSGSSETGVEETGPLVQDVKNFCLDFTRKIKADILLVDTAAGTHCPVISALYGLTQAYVVAEPTPMGAYDLKKILELCEKLQIPSQVILNQSDLGDKNLILEVAENKGVEIKKEIPYSNRLAQSYSQGQLLNFSF